ncbi:MAG: hypothetical protein ABI661_06150 [Gammaproteobacteria bacterium]
MKIQKTVPVIAALLLMSLSALAHDDATLDKLKPPNGGQLRAAGIYHYELVVAPGSGEEKAAPVNVYLTDHAGAKIPSAGASGSVTILSGARKSSIALQPDGDNRMKGSGTYRSTADMKVIVSIALPGKSAEQARFTPMAGNAPDAPAGHR